VTLPCPNRPFTTSGFRTRARNTVARDKLLVAEMALRGQIEAVAAERRALPPGATLLGGLKASERERTPISPKFEIDDGSLQLSVYSMNDDTFKEVVADPNTGAIKEAENIKDANGERRC